MKNEIILPKSIKMKKISARESLYIQDGLVSNGHWLISMSWLASIKKNRSLGMISFCNSILKEQVKATSARLRGDTYKTHDLKKIVNGIDLKSYRPIKEIEFHFGFLRGNLENYSAVMASLNGKNAPYLDAEYSALLYMDPATIILTAGEKDPVIMQNEAGEIVAMVCPLDPERIDSFYKNKTTK